jgi:hypothetical protein
MRFALPLLLLLAAAAPAGASPAVKARTTACLTSLEQASRAARFEGDIRTIPGALKLQIRFTLQARTDEDPDWADVAAPGFGTWISSDPGIARFVYVKTVGNLLAPADYRTVVQFRWLGAAGRSLQRARRVSRVCHQPDLRPDLVPGRLAAEGDAYAFTVVNQGRSDAGAFRVTAEAGGRVYELGRVARLAAGARTVLRGPLPECRPGEVLTLRVDPEGDVDEADEGANVALESCPGPVSQ